MAGELLLALDLGTTVVRARLYGPDGRPRGAAQRTLPVAFPAPGRVEQDPEVLYRHARDVLCAALVDARAQAQDVAALGIATQRATALAWHAHSGKALAPALGWQDQREAARLLELRAQGLAIGTQPSLAKFLWWLEEEPAVRAAARAGTLRLGTPDVWLGQRLSGGALHATDPGQAGCTGLYDPGAGDWAQGFLDLLGIDAAWLPEIVPTASRLGETAADRFGGPIVLAARAGDQQASAFAAGLKCAGEAKLTLGTAAMVERHTGASPLAPSPGTVPLPLWRLPDEGESYCLEGHVTAAGAALEWCVRLGLARDVPALAERAASVRGSAGVVCVPAFQGLGTPYAAEGARGLIGGLTRGSGAAELARSVFEGVAQRCIDVWEALDPDDPEIRADGGLARSDLMLQLLADYSGRPVRRAREIEGTAAGAAALAARAIGLEPAEPERAAADTADKFQPAIGADERGALRSRWAAHVRHGVLAAAATRERSRGPGARGRSGGASTRSAEGRLGPGG